MPSSSTELQQDLLASPRLRGNEEQLDLAKYVLMLCADASPTIPESNIATARRELKKRVCYFNEAEVIQALRNNPAAMSLYRAENTLRLREKFRTIFQELGFDRDATNDMWKLFFEGIIQQRELLNLKKQHDRDKNDSDPALKIGVRTQHVNASYQKIAQRMRDKNYLSHNGRLALWSGGFGVMKYARDAGYTCLESTRLGKLLQEKLIYRNEATLFNLWNYLSDELVGQFCENGVHVFVRTFDAESVLIRIEYKHLLELQETRSFQIYWHVLVGDDDHLRELNQEGELLSAHRPDLYFSNPIFAELALRNYYQSLSDEDRLKLKNYAIYAKQYRLPLPPQKLSA